MTPVKIWQRRSKNEKTFIIFIALMAFLGIVTGHGLGQIFGKGEVLNSEVKSKKEQALILKSLEPISPFNSNKFTLKSKKFGDPYLFNGQVIYLKNKKTASIKTIIQSPTLIETSGPKQLINDLFKSFSPTKKINSAYLNKERGAFIWIKQRGKKYYLIYSKNISQYPGDIE